MTTGRQQNDGHWSACDSGLIADLVQRRRNRRRTVFAAQLAGGALLGGLLAFLVTGELRPFAKSQSAQEFHYGGISCTEVRSHLGSYLKGDVDEPTAARIRVHLNECPHCAALLKRMRDDNRRTGRLPGPKEPPQSASTSAERRRSLLASVSNR